MIPAYGVPVFEPLDPDRHDRGAFDSGVSQVDNFLRQTASKLTRAGNLQTFVLASGSDVIGFHAVNAFAINFSELPARFARTRPRHGGIPAAFIAMIGVDRRFQGQGLGRDILMHALARAANAAESVGIAMVLLDVLDCGDAVQTSRRLALYLKFGFEPLPSYPLRLYLPMPTIRRMLEASR